MFFGLLFMEAHRQGEYVSAIYVLPYAAAVIGGLPFMDLIEKICDRFGVPE